jgi:hypothetical protein
MILINQPENKDVRTLLVAEVLSAEEISTIRQ